MIKRLQVKPKGTSTTLKWSKFSMASIACGEGLARICNLALLVFISRKLGVQALGAYALAQALALYLAQGIDLGLRHIGAGLVASQTGNICPIVHSVQRKRIILSIPVILLGYCYGRFGPIPNDARSLVSLYAISMIGYAFSLDWVAWGMKSFAWMSGWRAAVSFIGLIVTVFSIELFRTGIQIIALGNCLAYFFASYLLWTLWAKQLLNSKSESSNVPGTTIDWKPVLWMGLAMMANQVFSSIDILILGSLSTSIQTGLYSAAYRLFLLVLAVYYLIMQSIYPQLAVIPSSRRNFHTLQPYLGKIACAGIFIAFFMESIRTLLIHMLYGRAFSASIELSMPILLSIPLELVASFLLTSIIAWGQARVALSATVIAGISNAALNIALVPRFGALGSAYATPISFCVFLLVLLVCMGSSVSRMHLQDGPLTMPA